MARVFTVDEAAEYLHVTPYTVRKWLRKGKMRGRKIGRIYRILACDLEQLLGAAVEDEGGFRAPGVKLRAAEVFGRFPRPGRSLEDFLRDQRKEAEDEERRWKEEHGA